MHLTHSWRFAEPVAERVLMARHTPCMDLKERELRRMEAVKRLRQRVPARVVADASPAASNPQFYGIVFELPGISD